MAARPAAQGKAAKKPPRAAPRKLKKKTGKAPPPPTWWDWKTPDESWKMRWAARLVLGLLLLLACWTGEIRYRQGEWRAGLRGLRGEIVVGLQWRWGEWPRRWP
jgi:hypothetical protein